MVNPQKYRAQKMSYQCLSWCYRNKAFLSDSVIQSHQHVWMFCGFLKCYTYLVISLSLTVNADEEIYTVPEINMHV